ncbi:spore germination protein [Paenibacillus hemerocallicola]|uniref:Spore germination protein n=1 Tax=Paenibacillus hemerocallicola TaxID=1172614 RepID=A0A5C4T9X5_9BACL|nr:spore germination protein [Paenibacillus hemerocallicola]TNJ65199.1 spore germination protein [Paenibacillus hemerocallicola]
MSRATKGGSPKEPVKDDLYIDQLKKVPFSGKIEDDENELNRIMAESSDFVIRQFRMENGIKAIVCYVDGLSDTELVDRVIASLMIRKGDRVLLDELHNRNLPVSQISEADSFGEMMQLVLGGDAALLVDGNDRALVMGLRGAEHRNVSEPETESAVRGPREGFTELLRTNTALIRRKIKSPRLKMKPMVVGKETNTDIVVTYIDGLADPGLVEEVVRRIEAIDIDGILESGYIEELIQDHGYSPFPQIMYTERPDTAAGALLEGRVAIVTDGTPFVLIVPVTFWSFLQANEDYYERFQISTLLRMIRILFMVIALTTPALYIAVTTFHQEMLPTTLLLSVAAAREAIPFPAVVEALIMELSFEALREAGVRLPKAVGQAVSILGALVVGQAAVEAGIVSAPLVIVVSITGIASFAIPKFNAAISVRLLRFPLMLLASVFGLYGIVLGIMLIIGHMARLRSFGIPYLAPMSPLTFGDLKDTLVRAPWWTMKRRPLSLNVANLTRLGEETSGGHGNKQATGDRDEAGQQHK